MNKPTEGNICFYFTNINADGTDVLSRVDNNSVAAILGSYHAQHQEFNFVNIWAANRI